MVTGKENGHQIVVTGKENGHQKSVTGKVSFFLKKNLIRLQELFQVGQDVGQGDGQGLQASEQQSVKYRLIFIEQCLFCVV